MQCAARPGDLASPPSEPSHYPRGVDPTPSSTARVEVYGDRYTRASPASGEFSYIILPSTTTCAVLRRCVALHGDASVFWSKSGALEPPGAARGVRDPLEGLKPWAACDPLHPAPALESLPVCVPFGSLPMSVCLRCRSAGLACPGAGRSIFMGAARGVYLAVRNHMDRLRLPQNASTENVAAFYQCYHEKNKKERGKERGKEGEKKRKGKREGREGKRETWKARSGGRAGRLWTCTRGSESTHLEISMRVLMRNTGAPHIDPRNER